MTDSVKQLSSVVAKSDDGGIQITFSIPFSIIDTERQEALKEYAKDLEIPGFRKGMAPIDKVAEKVPAESLIEHTLRHILPRALAEAIVKHKIKPAIYPKFELVSAKEGEDWEVRAITCELPEIDLGDYKTTISGALRAKKLWVPGADKPATAGSKPESAQEEKQQQVITTLLTTAKINIPKVLIEEEVTARLANLLDRIEKLGLTLESYLSSLGKTPESLREEYATNAQSTITLDLALEKIAEDQKITASESKIDEITKESKLNTPEQRKLVAGIIRRRAALDYLTSLV